MPLKLRIQSKQQRTSGYRMRPLSFGASLGLHCIAVLLLILVPTQSKVEEPRVYREVIQRQARKIIWYDFRKPLPDVSAFTRVGSFPRPRGTELSRQAIIATSAHPKSDQQFI